MTSPSDWKIGGYYVKHLIDPRRWWAFVLGRILEKYISFSYCEQVVFRSLACPDCFEAGKCKSCSCKLPDKAMIPSEECDLLNWGPMLEEDEWKEYKQNMGITITIYHGL